MKNEKQNYHQLAAALEAAISRPPAQAGLRLLPEHELATLFNVSRMKMRRALDLLFAKGYLSRSRGCGTFLRKVILDGESKEPAPDQFPIIFDTSCISDSGRIADRAQQKLRLSLWHDFSFYDTNINILKGMKKAAEDRGHSFKDITMMKAEGVPLEVNEIRKLVLKERFDGYVVSLPYAPLFYEALEGVPANCIFIYPGACQIDYEPLIQINLFDATHRAIRKLHQSGYRRIAMLGLDRTYRVPDIYDEAVAYNLTVDELKLDYRMPYIISPSIESVTKAVFDLFDNSSVKPDAIYIADEHFLPTFMCEIEQRNIKLGTELGLITHYSSARKSFGGIEFSRMEIDINEFGAMAIDTIIQSIMTAGRKVCNLSLNATWRPGTTHIRS